MVGLSLLLAVVTAEPAAKIRIAFTDFTTLKVDAEMKRFLVGHLAQELALQGTEVVTPDQLAALLGMERQRQLLGCTGDSTACMAELANAMGADAVVFGDLSRVGDAVQMSLKAVRAQDAQQLSVVTVRAISEEALVPQLSDASRQLATEVSRQLGRPLLPATSASLSRGPPRWSWWAPAAVAVGLAVPGTVLLVLTRQRYDALQMMPPPAEASQLRREGSTFQTAGWALISIAGVAAAVAVGFALWLLLGRDP